MNDLYQMVCLHPFSALPRHEVSMFPPIQSVANQSGDAKSCVSRGENAFIITISLHAFHCHGLLVFMCLWHQKTVGQTRGTDIRM